MTENDGTAEKTEGTETPEEATAEITEATDMGRDEEAGSVAGKLDDLNAVTYPIIGAASTTSEDSCSWLPMKGLPLLPLFPPRWVFRGGVVSVSFGGGCVHVRP